MNEVISNLSTDLDPTIVAIKGDNLSLIYVFECGCELPTNYKTSFLISNACGVHHLFHLKTSIEKTQNWKDIPFID